MLWMGGTRSAWARCINRIGAFYLEMAKAEIDAGSGLLDGFVIWGDVAYKKSHVHVARATGGSTSSRGCRK